MIVVAYSQELGGHRVRAYTLDSAWNTLARRHGAWRTNAMFVNGTPAEAIYQIDIQRRDGAVIASGRAVVTKG